MANLVHGWRRLLPAALVVVGWIFFLTAPMLENTWLKYSFLVAARALPRALP